jgi:nitrogen fixation protein FixH
MTIRFNWGTAIAVTYTAFAAATTGFVAFAMHRPVDLVSPDYYADSLREDQHMQAVRNARELGASLSIAATDGGVMLSLPRDQAGTTRGTVTLYRPSDASADRVVALEPDGDGRQRVSLEGLRPGQWLVQIRWNAGGREYYAEKPVIAP